MVTRPTVDNTLNPDPWGPARFLGASVSKMLGGPVFGDAFGSMFRRGNQSVISKVPQNKNPVVTDLEREVNSRSRVPQNRHPAVTDLEREVNSPGGYGQKWTRGYNPANNPGDEGINGAWSLADAAAQVKELMASLGMGGEGGGVSFDPMRAQARAQWSDADARTLAMYTELGNAIAGDAGTLNKTYDEAVANTNAATEFANKQNLQAQQGLNAMTNQQAGALGIEEAVANTINSGNYATRDAADRVADTTSRGQITSNLMNTNRASALDYNTDLVGSARLAGAQQRSVRLNELNRLLAGYDVQEQEARARSASDLQGQTLDAVFKLMGINRGDIKQLDEATWRAQQESNRWDIANLPGQSITGRPAPMDQATARAYVIDLYGKDAFKGFSTQKAAKDLYLKLQGY